MKTCNRIPVHMNDLHIDLENIFDQLFGGKKTQPGKSLMPRTNIVETETGFVVMMELPGVSTDDVNVEVADGKLQVSGEKKMPAKAEGDKVLREERVSGKFSRSFEFPTQVDFEKIEATFDLGVLTVVLPKSDKVLPRKIDIRVKR